jgi:hypothetical protein
MNLTGASQAAVLTAILAFGGVLITLIVGTIANFQLAKRRNEFERELAQQRFNLDSQLAVQKLEDERAARNELRAENARLRHIEFQRQTLLHLQEAMLALVRTTLQIHFRDTKHAGEVGQWSKPLVPDAISDENRTLFAKTTLLVSRVRDTKLRRTGSNIKSLCTGLITATSQEQAEKARDELTFAFHDFNDQLAAIIRHLDDEDTSLSV